MTKTTVQGRRVRLLASWEAPGAVLDAWEDLSAGQGSRHRTGVVVTFRDGHDYLDGSTGVAHPFVPSPVYAAAYEDRPSADPVVRFQEALRQERDRAAERLGGPVRMASVAP